MDDTVDPVALGSVLESINAQLMQVREVTRDIYKRHATHVANTPAASKPNTRQTESMRKKMLFTYTIGSL